MFLLKVTLNKRTILSKELSCYQNSCNSNGITSIEYEDVDERNFLSNDKWILVELENQFKKRHSYESSEILNLDNIKENCYIEI